MAGLPTIQFLLDDGTGTFPYDITSKARLMSGYGIKRGRQDEQSDVTASDLLVALDNTDGRFTVGSTIIGSPSPIKTDTRIRLKLTANATTVNRWTGYLEGLPVSWPSGSDVESRVVASAFDALARLERHELLSVIEEEVGRDNPIAYYTLSEPTGAVEAHDSAWNGGATTAPVVGSGADVVFGVATGPGTDGLTAATFANGKYLQGVCPAVQVGGIMCTFLAAAPPSALAVLAVAATRVDLEIDTSGYLVAAGTTLTSNPIVVTDGQTHTAEMYIDGATAHLVLDGVEVDTAGFGSSSDSSTGIQIGSGFTGTIAHVAVFGAGGAGASRVDDHAEAVSTGFDGESGTEWLTRLAAYAGIPIGTLDTSLTNIPFVDFTAQSAGEVVRAVADAEVGIAFVAGDGELDFHNRNRPVAKLTPDITIAANQLDEGTAFEYDKQGIINHFTVTSVKTGVSQIVRSVSSDNAHGRYASSKSYLVATDAEALDRGAWVVGNHAEPAPRMGSVVVDVLTMTAAEQAAVLAIEPNTWVRITGLPSQAPGGTTADLLVQGWSESLTGSEWKLTLNVVAKSLFQAWILGDATYGVLGTTTRLYV